MGTYIDASEAPIANANQTKLLTISIDAFSLKGYRLHGRTACPASYKTNPAPIPRESSSSRSKEATID
ncbi:hypothetical protein J19TS2_53060 [Cohnella xylanilytica]|uniref:hypothetical protein n=1 Tax=Cohnella xylanilytica TaxID=557555 RepID=UPI001B24782E|nr:hypothetical protein [Cohnella xylanilytica]GIO15751.1 hypothetical protein J19TS2_53060 [Cohnella xylanilytica]